MALQGSIETFALPDVLRLLASTSKTGRLRLSGTSGSGNLWVAEGKLVDGDVSTATTSSPTDVLFELLRFSDGDFSFDQDETASDPGSPTEVDQALTDAEAMLEEWQSLEAVVPSMDAWASLRAEIDGEEITLSADNWQALVIIGGGLRARDYGAARELSDIEVMRQLRDLTDQGVVDIGSAPADAPAAPPPPPPAPVTSEEPVVEAAPEQPVATDDGADDTDHGTQSQGFEPFDPGALVIDEGKTVESIEADVEPEPEPIAFEPEPEMDAADIARQLATLSPAAAKAVAAAAKASTPEEREEALAAIPEEEGALNRDLLLKFLGSVNS